jgi:hypothetical protein
MHFASTSISTSTVIKILFPTMEEVVKTIQNSDKANNSVLSALQNENKIIAKVSGNTQALRQNIVQTKKVAHNFISGIEKATTSKLISGAQANISSSASAKDTRIAEFFRSLFGK